SVVCGLVCVDCGLLCVDWCVLTVVCVLPDRAQGGVLSLIECTLVEELDANDEDYNAGGQGFNHLEFKIVVEPPDGPAFSVVLLAPSRQEKAAWTSDISQCIDNIRCNGLMTSVFEENSKVTVPHMIKSDARLHKDDVDICFSKTLNSCKVPQIRYASVERLLERLTDLRFLSIDFLNTFLHTYRIFTTAAVVMDKLADIYKKPFTSIPVRSLELFFATNQGTWGGEHLNNKSPRLCRKFSSPPPLTIPSRTSSPVHSRKLSLSSPVSSKAGVLDLSTPSSSAANSPTSSHPPSISSPPPNATRPPSGFSSPPPNATRAPSGLPTVLGVSTSPSTTTKALLELSRPTCSQEPVPPTPEEGGDMPRIDAFCGKLRRSIRRAVLETVSLEKFLPESNPQVSEDRVPLTESPCRSPSTPRHMRYRQSGGSTGENNRGTMSPASAFAIATAAAGHGSPGWQEAWPQRSMTNFLKHFMAAEVSAMGRLLFRQVTLGFLGTGTMVVCLKHVGITDSDRERLKMSVKTLASQSAHARSSPPSSPIFSASSHANHGDLGLFPRKQYIVRIGLLPLFVYIRCQPVCSADMEHCLILVYQAECPKAECFESLSAMELAEQITLLDHIVFRSIPYEEFLGQGWMKLDKSERTPYIMKTSQHFNDMSNLVASQIIAHTDVGSRANSIEKWLAVADICRCLNNYNGVLEITSALNRSAIYRLKKTWAKVCKQTKSLMDRLQKTVSSEGRFKNLRETLKNCNPPCVPYLGMYLTDLAFIEEGTPNFTEEGLVNFSKMRMISHIIREIRQFQGAPYRIEHQAKVTQFLLDKTLVMDEDTLYELSLKIEPRIPPG
ncbi:unnamed protein product, partial [Oncorhynchus mykiss]